MGSADEVYSWDGSNWQRMPGALTDVSVVAPNLVWGVNRGQEIFHWDGSNWHKVDGAAVNISVGKDGTVWCINKDQDIFFRYGPQGHWDKVDGKLVHVSCFDRNTVIGNNAAHEIFSWHEGSGWQKNAGATTCISVGKKNYKKVWGVNAGQDIWSHSH